MTEHIPDSYEFKGLPLVNPPLTRNVTLTIAGETVWMENIDLGPGKVHFIGYDMKAGRWVSVQSIPERQPGA